MSTESPSEKIRQAIAWQLQRFGVQQVDQIHETLLIRHGLFCGRRLECEGYQVVWFIEEDEIKFFSPVGDLLKITSTADSLLAFEQSNQDRRAA